MTKVQFSLKNTAAKVAFFVKFSVFATIGVALFSGCFKEYYTVCDHDYAAMDTYYYTVRPNEWRSESGSDGTYFFYSYRLPKITANVIENGVVLCYFIDDSGRDNLLPYLRPCGFNGFGEPFSQNIRFDVEKGYVTFIIEASDFDFPYDPTGNMKFKVVVIQNYRH